MLVSEPQSVHAARRWVREFVESRLPATSGARAADIELVVSELVTNGIRYGSEPGDSVLVVLDVRPALVRVEVHDPVRRRPRGRAVSHQRARGRGLFIVAALAERWGVEDRPFGKSVWAELAR
ncbi:ATP-binding protein [Streptomyces paludis]|uniref:ATP-binding protein n=2 Tax=Streptomyces paludis TaxID=2282738 RepID=A0A345HUB9_9ACTN|nr:ATP-binding protein [Streptomyces paludis]AXG80293.1 ATP-binding protein [Streptomyces paludis]